MSKTQANEALQRAKAGKELQADEIVALLGLDENSPEAREAMAAAHEKSLRISRGRGQIWYAIGLDSSPCPNTCAFCSFSKKWRASSATWELEPEQIIELVRKNDLPGVSNIVLRTTVLFPLAELLELGAAIGPLRHAGLTANVGDLTAEDARKLARAGFRTAYHTWRLREGVDTNIPPQDRLRTISAIADSELELAALVEPVGQEHGLEELAERVIAYRAAGVALSGAMARVNIPGTPKADLPAISQRRLAQITAVIRLALDHGTHSICSHPPALEVAQAGANTVVVESGAIPRDLQVAHGSWNAFGTDDARELLAKAGYTI